MTKSKEEKNAGGNFFRCNALLGRERILNSASALGLDADIDTVLQFASDMQAAALVAFGEWCREYGDEKERIYWADAAINAEFCAMELGPITVDVS